METGFIADTGNDLLKYLEGCRWWICFIWGIIQWEYSSFVVHIVFQPVHLLGWKNVHDNNAYRMRVSYIMDRPFNIHLHHALYIYNNYIYIYLSSHLHSMVWAQKWLMIAVNMSYLIWSFPKIIEIIQVIRPWLSIETYGFWVVSWESPILWNPRRWDFGIRQTIGSHWDERWWGLARLMLMLCVSYMHIIFIYVCIVL